MGIGSLAVSRTIIAGRTEIAAARIGTDPAERTLERRFLIQAGGDKLGKVLDLVGIALRIGIGSIVITAMEIAPLIHHLLV